MEINYLYIQERKILNTSEFAITSLDLIQTDFLNFIENRGVVLNGL